ncbi:hypothetical protein [Catenulispora pinisilvae]|uniref:hypothetical protein n=1 Tax=Catenulispora pinisilvae TaxID=2705253 RepID=UPI0018911322|nr:hypothetical protein [Catenulispora pinisilvae]
MPATNPWQEVNQQLWQATPTGAAVVALSCLRQASAVFEAATVQIPSSAPFGTGSLAHVDLHASTRELLVPIMAAKPEVARYAADPETGELPEDEESNRGELLGMAAEMVMRTEPEMDEDGVREWADMCSTMISDICQHLDMLDYEDVRDAPDNDPPGPLSAGVLDLQREILALVAAPDETTMEQVSQLVETAHGPLLTAVRDAIDNE